MSLCGTVTSISSIHLLQAEYTRHDTCTITNTQGIKVNARGKEMPHGVRLYSIGSSRYGDSYDGKTTSLCVRRATYWDPETQKDDPAKAGICSNFLCDAKPGQEIQLTGREGLRSSIS